MSTRSTLSALTATAIASAGLVAAQDAAAATGSFSCSAAAISGTVLGQAITPVAGAGGDGPCQTADGTSAFTTPLGGSAIAKTLLSGATGDVGAQRATSTAGVQGLAVGGLSSLLPALPAASLPAGLSALEIPLPVVAPVISGVTGVTGVTGSLGGLLGGVTGTTGTGTGSTTGSLLPSKITVDALDAVKALVPAGALPNLDLLKLDGLTSTATAACQAGTAVLRGVTDIAGLQSLGQPLPVDQAVSRVVALADPQNIPVGGLDLSLVKLPAGLRFDDPVVGTVLQTAVRTVLASLPPITIPAVVGEVKVTPASTEDDGTTLLQRGPRVTVTALGRELADVTLGSARVSALGVDCGLPVAAPAAIAPASQLAVQCAKRRVTLVDVAERPQWVSLLGAAAASEVGSKVSIVYTKTGKVVSTATVRDSGFFRAKAPLPPKAERDDNDARYMAVIENDRSMSLKLQRRMRISRMSNRG
ncbi:MAG: hypothetical protein JWP18_2206, partial [Solirubrobacterales bacterium]|nr:hypothetical protein [Solirubrobacterales bacterium]